MDKIDWNYDKKIQPQSIGEMSLYKDLKDKLSAVEKLKNLKHSMFIGSPGTGKTTSARILARLIDEDFYEHDCSADNSIATLKGLMEGMKSRNVFTLAKSKSEQRVIILDEFSDVKQDTQKVFKKFMEDFAHKCIVIICANDPNLINPAIVDRCVWYNFEVGVNKDGRFLVLPHTGYKKNVEWENELIKSATAIEKKLGIKIPKKIVDKVLLNPRNVLSVRSFVRSLQSEYESVQ